MSAKTKIQWCDFTWNPWRGCRRVSAGCVHCYIERTAPLRIAGYKLGDPRIRASEAVRTAPLKWNKRPWLCDTCGRALPAHMEQPGKPYVNCWHEDEASYHRGRVFLGSTMDIFDGEVPIEWLADALQIVNDCKDLDFLFVTKRPELWRERMINVVAWENEYRGRPAFADFWLRGKAPANVWVITSTENQEMLEKRVPLLLDIPAAVHGLSCEPLLGPLDLHRAGATYTDAEGDITESRLTRQFEVGKLHWVIAGGESGPGARGCDTQWIRSIQQDCASAGVAFFLKQFGSNVVDTAQPTQAAQRWKMVGKWGDGVFCPTLKDKKGGNPEEWPEAMRVRQWPEARR